MTVVAAGRSPGKLRRAIGVDIPRVECDITREEDVRAVLSSGFDAVVNCAGLTKALCGDAGLAAAVNARAPHVLAEVCSATGARLVHVSTDCVFWGESGGPFDESAQPDAEDVYGRTKAEGEIHEPPHLTVRTSFVGREFKTRYGLLEWFLSSTGLVRGFTRHLWTGLGAPELARVLLELGLNRTDVSGLLNVAGEEIDKLTLLTLFRDVYGRDDITIEPDESTAVDRRLADARLRALGIEVPPIRKMIEDVHAIGDPFDKP